MARQYKNARKSQKLIVKDTAAKLDISPSALGAWESERNINARSLAKYRKNYTPKYSVKTSVKNEANEEDVLNIPLYLISALERFTV